jgi:hypothetical protein
MSITVVNLQDNRAVFQIFIALLKFSFDSPFYLVMHTFYSMEEFLTNDQDVAQSLNNYYMSIVHI